VIDTKDLRRVIQRFDEKHYIFRRIMKREYWTARPRLSVRRLRKGEGLADYRTLLCEENTMHSEVLVVGRSNNQVSILVPEGRSFFSVSGMSAMGVVEGEIDMEVETKMNHTDGAEVHARATCRRRR